MEKGVFKISDVETKEVKRISTQIPYFDEIYGGGLPRGRVSIWSGASGVGKSRTTIYISKLINRQGGKVMVFQNEVSPSEFKQWVQGQVDEDRYLVSNYDTIEEQVKAIRKYKPDLVITDSLNMIQGFSSSVQIRNIMDGLKDVIREVDAHAILIGHLNGEGETKGNTDIPHLVDVVCHLKPHEDWKDEQGFKHKGIPGVFILSISKNRYGKSGGWISFKHINSGLEEGCSSASLDANKLMSAPIAPTEQGGTGLLSKVFTGICRYIEGKTG